MSKEIEIEFKTLLTKEEYVNLCTKFADKRGNLQINYYFDTPRFTLKASEIGPSPPPPAAPDRGASDARRRRS